MKGNEDACNVMPNSQDSGHATIDPAQIENSRCQKQLGKYSFKSNVWRSHKDHICQKASAKG